LYSGQFGIETKVARGFAFAGPYLPLDRHFAIGNFIADGLRGGPLLVKGDGTPCRSYLYAADLAIWLWTILVRGKSCRPYNVGSDEDLSIAEVARWVAEEFGGLPVQVAAHPTVNMEADRYVPNLVRAQQELGLRRCFSLAEALRMTVAYYRGKPGSVD
jgi:dTDP-glucose 4,6-dehydratase